MTTQKQLKDFRINTYQKTTVLDNIPTLNLERVGDISTQKDWYWKLRHKLEKKRYSKSDTEML